MASGGLRRATQTQQLNAVFAALADPTRRAIIETLSHGEARVTELAKPFDMSLNAVSKHIRVLENIGLVRRRVAGRDHYLTFDSRRFDEAELWMDRARKFWNARLDGMESFMKLQETAGK
jgi:DNA-binding transcriptional ArsR family regulator